MLIGLAGCGKTQSCTGLLKKLNPEAAMALVVAVKEP
jgi:signal recognition particle GTPase